jgi:hypothetical protein
MEIQPALHGDTKHLLPLPADQKEKLDALHKLATEALGRFDELAKEKNQNDVKYISGLEIANDMAMPNRTLEETKVDRFLLSSMYRIGERDRSGAEPTLHFKDLDALAGTTDTSADGINRFIDKRTQYHLTEYTCYGAIAGAAAGGTIGGAMLAGGELGIFAGLPGVFIGAAVGAGVGYAGRVVLKYHAHDVATNYYEQQRNNAITLPIPN